MEARDSVFSFRVSSPNCMAAKSVFPLRPGRAVSDLALSIKLSFGAEPVLGTFAFYVKGRRASPPAEKTTQQIEAQPGKCRPTSPIKARKSQIDNSTESTSLPLRQGSQSKVALRNFRVLLVEDNLVNRRCCPPPSTPWALIMD